MSTIDIKGVTGSLLFSHTCEGNSIKLTIEKAVSMGANLRGANLRDADLRGANLRDANLCGANLGGADLKGANLSGTNLYGAYLEDANLIGANLIGAYLRNANLISAYLEDANLIGAKLWNTKGDQTYIKNINTPTYNVCYTSDRLQIGCKNYSFEKWLKFNDQEIEAMDSEALSFWKENKELIFDEIEANPAKRG